MRRRGIVQKDGRLISPGLSSKVGRSVVGFVMKLNDGTGCHPFSVRLAGCALGST